jgi:hypothetical protein
MALTTETGPEEMIERTADDRGDEGESSDGEQPTLTDY